MNKFTKNQTFTLTTDDQQQLTYTIKDIDESGRLLVHSSLLEKAYFVTAEAFEDFLWVIGRQEPLKYTLRFLTLTSITTEHDTFNEALLAAERIGGWAFQIELGDMVCATWSPLMKEFKFTEEYKSWYQSQQYMLAKVEGSYP